MDNYGQLWTTMDNYGQLWTISPGRDNNEVLSIFPGRPRNAAVNSTTDYIINGMVE